MINLSAALLVSSPQDVSSSFPIIVQPFYNLALIIFYRAVFRGYKWPEDVKCCIICFRYLHRQWHQFSMKFSIPVTTLLVGALAVHVELKLGDVDEDIEEMADLCDALLKSDISIQFVIPPIADLARAINVYLKDHLDWKIRSDKVINCLKKAILRLPDLHGATLLLAKSLLDRLVVAPSDDDYKGAMAICDAILIFRGSGDEPSPYREAALRLAALLADARFDRSGKPEHLEHAIYRVRAMIDGTSIEDPNRAINISRLSYLEGLRLDGTANTLLSLGKLPSFREFIAPFLGPMAVKPDSMTDSMTHMVHLVALLSYTHQLTDVAYIKDGIEYCRLLPPRGILASTAQIALGNLLHRAFRLTHKIEYLNEAISLARDGINAFDSFSNRVTFLSALICFLSTRLEFLSHEEDFHELMQLFPTLADYTFANPHAELQNSFRWASIARRFGHPSVSTAYDHAMSWMRTSLTFAPTLDKQHSRLVAVRDSLDTIPLDYTSYHIDTGNLEKAIETLEQGRGLLWSEMRGLRTSIDRLRLADSDLAKKFSMVNRKLEALVMAPSLNNNVDGSNGLQGMDTYGLGVIRKQKLFEDREKLITQIRALSGFDTFLKPPSFDTLRFAASHGPVIIINHCEWRSDILILLHNSPPSLIPTSDDFYICAKKLQDQLLAERNDPGSNAYEDALRAVLKELYELVGRPVIKRLNELNIPEQSRVWWCPTSVFCSLPLHAMGPIPSDGGPSRYFLDLYIPSYTPSLSALIDSHKPNSQIFEKPSVLLVLQPDEFMVRALDEMKAVQRASSRATTLIGATATPSVVLERLRDHRFVHIVCHGLLEPGKPFDSSFKLFQGKRLSLHAIVQSQLPNAEFAFLAACHTAELTDESPVDEALHLAAAMQYCGFRSVVGTMWAMADEDGRDLAENFYKSVFSGRKQGVPYHEITAEALRDAVVRLRRRRMTLERWVNYVHYGA